MIYLLLDCDEYLAAQRLAELKADLGDPELAGLNIAETGRPADRARPICWRRRA